MIQQKIIEEAQEFSNSSRWDDQDYPGSAHIEELHKRLNSPVAYKEFRDTTEGEYLLSVLEAYEDAFNDDWLPFEIVGLTSNNAKEFISLVAQELKSTNLVSAVGHLRNHYQRLSKP
ncbi:hypothetical protein KIJ96_09400 [Pseudoalteromonas piscicida]|uniref:hypothetical protein n=1 Tax=Pseudoalteromonas piscicida TaxID=43662 RepID=UPI001D0A1771|nr:hypothetical protein [Pseudoalteromonas piscicida]UDM60081.1 hypothetical protein KIJ96_09400 [Pseudoalteromonas piscicida]